MPVGHLPVLFGKMSIQVFCMFLIKLFGFFFFFMLNCMSCLYMLDINPLPVIPFANIFSHSVGCLFIVSKFFKFTQVSFAYNPYYPDFMGEETEA